jgi:hypothetical protein
MSRAKSAVRLMFAIILPAGLSEPAAAELLVIVADGVDVTVGAELPDDQVFDVPDNGKLVVVQSTTKISYAMGGPYTGTLANYFAACRSESRSSKLCGPADR